MAPLRSAEALPSADAAPRWAARVAFPIRLGLALGVLAIERIAGFAFRLDLPLADKQASIWVLIGGNAGVFLRVGLVAAATLALLLAPRLGAITRALRRDTVDHPWAFWLAAHLAAFALFVGATSIVETERDSGHVSSSVLAVWFALGLVTASLWLLILAPPRRWLASARREWRALAISMAAGVAAWLGGLLMQDNWDSLARSTLRMAQSLLQWFYPHVIADPSAHVLGTPGFTVYIGAPCSGVEGIALVSAALAAYLIVFRAEFRFPQVLLLFPLGASAMWLANAVRIAALIAIGSSYSKEVALVGFHSQAGWIAFTAVALGLMVLTRRWRLFSRSPHRAAIGRVDETASALLVPGLLLMTVVMVGTAASAGFDALYPLRPLVIAAALWRFRAVYRRWDWRGSWPAVAIGALVFAAWVALEPARENDALASGLAALPAGPRAAWLALRVIGSVLLVPVAEELAFRGYLLRRLAGCALDDREPLRFTWASFLVSSAAFGLLHGRWVAGTIAGMAFALAVYRRGRLSDAVVAHMTANALIAALVLLEGRWSLW